MKKIYPLIQQLLDKFYTGKIPGIIKMTAILFMIVTLNMFGNLTYSYGRENPEVKEIVKKYSDRHLSKPE